MMYSSVKTQKQNKALWKALSYTDTHPQLLLYLSTIWHSFCGLSLEGSTLPQSYKLKHVFFKRGTVWEIKYLDLAIKCWVSYLRHCYYQSLFHVRRPVSTKTGCVCNKSTISEQHNFIKTFLHRWKHSSSTELVTAVTLEVPYMTAMLSFR